MREATLARRFLAALEPVATLPWFAPETWEEYTTLGIPLGYDGYFLSRAAPFGAIAPEIAIALFYNWNPAMIRRLLVWHAEPAVVRRAYLRGASRAFARVLGEQASSDGVVKATALLREASEACPLEGRPIFAANAALPWPEESILALLHGATLLREFRGDTHNAILVSHGIGPVDALVLNGNWIDMDRDKYLATREWTPEDGLAAVARLQHKHYVDADGRLTDGGAKFREMVEVDTDRRCTAPIEALGTERAEEALALIEPLSKTILEARAVPGAVGRVAHGIRL